MTEWFGVRAPTTLLFLFKFQWGGCEVVGSNPHSPSIFIYLNGRVAVRLWDQIPTASLYFLVISPLPSALRSWVWSHASHFLFILFPLPSHVLGGRGFKSHASYLLVYLNFFPSPPYRSRVWFPTSPISLSFSRKQELGSNPSAPIFFFLCLAKPVAKGFDSP